MIDEKTDIERKEELKRKEESLVGSVTSHLKKVLLPEGDLKFLSKVLIFVVEFCHVIFSLISPFGFLLPGKFLIYHAIGLTVVLIGWIIFDGCIITILKSKIFGLDDTLIEFDFTILKIFQVSLIGLCIFFYRNQNIAPFVVLKRGVNFLDKL
jgi:hypothetical protein